MKETKLAPKNREFFAEHGKSLSAYAVIGAIGQTLSGLSLAYAVFALLVAQLFDDGTTATKEFIGLVALALTVAVFVELSNRVLARRAIRPFVAKDLFADDVDAAKRHKILNRSYLAGLVAVALLSYLFSIVGSTYYAEDSAPGPELVSLDSIVTRYAGQRADVLRTFAADSATLATPYAVQLLAARSRFAADSSALMGERSRYAKCAGEGNGYCVGQRRAFLTKIDKARSELAVTTARISQERAATLSAALATRDERAEELRDTEVAAVNEAKAINRTTRDEQERDAGFKGIIFIILTVAGQTLYYFMEYLQLQVEAGSGIEHQLEPNEFWGKPSVLTELRVTAAWRIERGLRRLIRWVFGEPDDDQETVIPYASLYTNEGTKGKDDFASAKGAFSEGGKVVVDGSIKQCKNCGKDFRPKAHNQAYCTVPCRTDFHTKKHNGRPFDAGRYHGRKPSKV